MAIKGFSLPEFLNTSEIPLCSTTDPEMFFPQEVEFYGRKTTSPKYFNLSAAKELCSQCPLQVQCLRYAIRNSEVGIWGGTTESQRESLRRNQRIKINKRPPSPKIW